MLLSCSATAKATPTCEALAGNLVSQSRYSAVSAVAFLKIESPVLLAAGLRSVDDGAVPSSSGPRKSYAIS